MFDPTLPQEGTPVDAVQIRNQLNGLKAIIDAILTVTNAQVDGVNTLPQGTPAEAFVSVVGNSLHFTFGIPQGQEGLVGPAGPPFASAVVDAVNTLDPGSPASVDANFDGTNVRLTFGIPRGNDGNAGPQGNDGSQGPPFAQAVVDSVNTLNPGDSATVGVTFDGANVRFTFGIPRGNDGASGSNGAQGPSGEVSNQQLSDAINATSSNSNNVSTLGLSADSNYNQTQLQDLGNKVDELINILRR